MADSPDSGLDPSVLSYLQGGAAPMASLGTAPAPAAPPVDFSPPPSVVSAVQNGFAPSPDTAPVDLSTLGTSGPDGAPGGRPAVPDANYGFLPPSVTSAIQSGFAPSSMPDTGSPLPAQVRPDYQAGIVDTNTGQLSQTPQQLAQTGAPAVDPRTGKAWTPQSLAQYQSSPEGLASRSDAEQRGAIDQERQANTDAAAAETAQNDAKATAIQGSVDRMAQAKKIDDAKRMAQQADVDKYTAQYAQQVKDAANYKVDTSRHVSNAGLIAIALSGIGDALDHVHGPNKAFEILEKGIDNRIQDQWNQKKALGETADQTKGVLGQVRQNADDTRQEQQLQRAAGREQLADDLQLTAAQTANPMVKARAEAAAAKLTQSSAQITMGEAQRKAQAIRDAQEQANKQAEIGVHYAQLQQSKDQFHAQYALQVAQLQASGNAADAKRVADQGEAARDRGMLVPTGKVLANGVPEQQPIKNDDGSVWLAPKDAAKDLGDKKAATEDFVYNTDEVRKAREKFDSADQAASVIMTTEEGRHMMQNYAAGLIALHKASGINRLSKEAIELTEKVASGSLDPDSIKSVLGLLDNGRQIAIDSLYSDLHGKGNYTGSRQAIYDAFPDPLKAPMTPEDYVDRLGRQANARSTVEQHEAVFAQGAGTSATTQAKLAGADDRMKAVQGLEAFATSSNPGLRERSISLLKDTAKNGITSTIRAAARESLDRISVTSGIDFHDGVPTGTAATTANIRPDEVIGRQTSKPAPEDVKRRAGNAVLGSVGAPAKGSF